MTHIEDIDGFGFPEETTEDARYPYNTVYNESGQIETPCEAEMPKAVGFRKPTFLKRRIADDMAIHTKEEAAVNGEFWMDTRRGPRVIRDLGSLGLEIGRDMLLDRRSGGC